MIPHLDQIARYDAIRDLGNKGFRAGCYSPFVSLFFDTLGRVRACCLNDNYILGDIRRQRLDQIWNGAQVARMRESLRNYDFSRGCLKCYWHLRDGNIFAVDEAAYNPLHAVKYDDFAVPAEGPWWPANMEFNLANTCNLECVMCAGTLSSAIRARRDRLPPLPRSYGEEFFQDLRKYLPHLQKAQFLGGEPFLVQEQYRVWDMLIEDGIDHVACQITTNATRYNDRVERVLQNLPCQLTVSIDGITPQTLESIRIGVKFDVLMQNIARFHEYAVSRQNRLCFNYALMTLNWHEFGEFLQFADHWDANVTICTCTEPIRYSLYHLDRSALGEVVESLTRQDATLRQQLGRTRVVWEQTLSMLQHRLEHCENPVPITENLRPTMPDFGEGGQWIDFSVDLPPTCTVPEEGDAAEACDSAEPDDSLEFLPSPAPQAVRYHSLTGAFVKRVSPDERQQLAAAISQTQEEFRGLGGASAVMRMTCDLEDQIEQLQSEGPGLLGVDFSFDWHERTDDDFFAWLRDQFGHYVKLLASDEGPVRVSREVQFRTEDGRITRIDARTFPRYDSQGNLNGSFTFCVARREAARAEPDVVNLTL